MSEYTKDPLIDEVNSTVEMALRAVAKLTATAELQQEYIKHLQTAIKDMAEYRNRAGAIGFQLEKFDDYLNNAVRLIHSSTN